ncbi:MAG: hypothetical protein Q8O14_08650 [bacterium]|jgi:hypothetical protein|nr:hypothetical protein [bacterium]
MYHVKGYAPDGRHAWLLSLRRGEWVAVDESQHRLLKRYERRDRIIRPLLTPLVIGLIYFPLVYWTALGAHHLLVFGLAFGLAQTVHEALWWRRLRAAGERIQGGVRFLTPLGHGPGWRNHLKAWWPLALMLFFVTVVCLVGWTSDEGRLFPLAMTVLFFAIAVQMILSRQWMWRLLAERPQADT